VTGKDEITGAYTPFLVIATTGRRPPKASREK
jgi:hypothetical protein